MGDALDIVLADDHVVFLDALTAVLDQIGHQVRAAATTRAATLDGIRAFRPDVCVAESRFPDGSFLDSLGDVSQVSPDTKVIILTSDGNPETLRAALEGGASGYVHKTRGVAVLFDVLRRVTEGEIVIEGSFVRPRPAERQAPVELRRLAHYLTHRELECLQLLAQGLDTAAMSRRLGVSRTTVRSHVQAVLTKLGVHSRLEAASLAIRFGLVSAASDPGGATGERA